MSGFRVLGLRFSLGLVHPEPYFCAYRHGFSNQDPLEAEWSTAGW